MQIIKFTNSREKVNFGIVIEHSQRHPDMVHVLWDAFVGLIEDLQSRKKLRTSDAQALGVRRSWCSVLPSPYVVAETNTELLPIDTVVNWHANELAALQQKAIALTPCRDISGCHMSLGAGVAE